MHTSRAFGVLIAIALSIVGIAAQRSSDPIAIDADDLAGIVSGPKGPEAGAWVIAETTDLPTRSHGSSSRTIAAGICCPTCPRRTLQVWVRGYGLVDSPKVQATPGKLVNLTAVVAPDARAAAQYYPAGYWFSLVKPARQERVSRHGADAATASRPASRLRPNGCATSSRAAASPVIARHAGHARAPAAPRPLRIVRRPPGTAAFNRARQGPT